MVEILCKNCGMERDMKEVPRCCSNCGTLFIKDHSVSKTKIIEKYFYKCASRLHRSNKWKRIVFIDACAGSGKVNNHTSKSLVDGSPIAVAKACEKFKKNHKSATINLRCIFIEKNIKTYQTLKENTKKYPFCKAIHGDSNNVLNNLLLNLKRSFVVVFIDPYGVTDIDLESIPEKIKENEYSELLIHFSWQAFSRNSGLNPEEYPENYKAVCKIIPNFVQMVSGKEWESLTPRERAIWCLDEYTKKLKKIYPYMDYIKIPLHNRQAYYYLIFSSKHPLGEQVMQEVVEEVKEEEKEKKRNEPKITLEEFL